MDNFFVEKTHNKEMQIEEIIHINYQLKVFPLTERLSNILDLDGEEIWPLLNLPVPSVYEEPEEICKNLQLENIGINFLIKIKYKTNACVSMWFTGNSVSECLEKALEHNLIINKEKMIYDNNSEVYNSLISNHIKQLNKPRFNIGRFLLSSLRRKTYSDEKPILPNN